MKKTFFILNWTDLPDPFKEEYGEYIRQNDCYIDFKSEFDGEALREGMKSIEKYYQDQKEFNKYVGTLEEFIKDYNLQFEVWIIEQKFDLEGVDQILIKVSW